MSIEQKDPLPHSPHGITDQELRKQQTVTATLTPIITALSLAEEVVSSNGKWTAETPIQRRFLESYYDARAELRPLLEHLSPDDPLKIASIASEEAAEINRFLQEHGFSINLDPFPAPPPLRFGVASVMDVFVEWPNKGESEPLLAADNNTYPGVMINRASAYMVNQHEPVVYLQTKNRNYQVGMIIPDSPIDDAFDLIDFVTARKEELGEDIMQRIRRLARRYQGVIFPKVSLDQEPDIGWLEGMWTPGHYKGVSGHSIIEQALQQTKFKMNETGARAESAVAIRIATLGAPAPEPEPYRIDRPFVCWIEKEGISLPLFVAYIQYADWKEPGSLAR